MCILQEKREKAKEPYHDRKKTSTTLLAKIKRNNFFFRFYLDADVSNILWTKYFIVLHMMAHDCTVHPSSSGSNRLNSNNKNNKTAEHNFSRRDVSWCLIRFFFIIRLFPMWRRAVVGHESTLGSSGITYRPVPPPKPSSPPYRMPPQPQGGSAVYGEATIPGAATTNEISLRTHSSKFPVSNKAILTPHTRIASQQEPILCASFCRSNESSCYQVTKHHRKYRWCVRLVRHRVNVERSAYRCCPVKPVPLHPIIRRNKCMHGCVLLKYQYSYI